MKTQYPFLPPAPLQKPGLFRLVTRLLLWASITLLNATALVAQTGQALRFDGVDDYVSLGTSLGNFGTGDFTIEIKLQTTFSSATSSFSESPILMKREDCGSGNLFGLKLNTNGTLTWVMNEANGVNYQGGTTTGIACNDGAWHQATVVRSGSSLKVYIDGIESMTLTGTTPNLNNGSPLLIGLDGLSCNSNRFPGSIDELRIWNVARTATQIAEGKDCELKGDEAGLVAYFNCNQGIASGDNSGLINLTNAVSGGPAGKLANFGLTGTTSNWVSPGGAVKCVNCNTYITRTTANGLGNNKVYDVFAVGNTVYAATAGGLSISTDGGQTFTNKVINGSVTSANVYVTGNSIYTTAGGVLARSTDGGQTFTTLNSQNNSFLSLFAQGNIIIVPNGSSYALSTNGGSSFASKQVGAVYNSKGKIYGVFGAGGTLYLAASGEGSPTGGGLYVSTDNGQTFTLKSNVRSDIQGAAVYVVNNMIYYAAKTGLFISADGGVTFTQRTTANGLGNNGVTDVFVVGNRVYAATVNGLSISTDGGQTFTNHTTANGLAAAKINAMYAVGTIIYAATDAGLSIANFAVQTSKTTTNAIGTNTTTTVVPTITIAPGQSVVLTAAANTTYNWSNGNSNTRAITVNTSDLYSVTATGDCPGTASVQVTVLQPSTGTTTTQTPLSAANCPVKLTATNLTGQRFLGTGPGGYVFNDAYPSVVTGKEISLTNIRQSGTYTIQSINAAGVTTAVNTFNVTGSGCN